MAVRNAKRSISTILRKNRGTVNSLQPDSRDTKFTVSPSFSDLLNSWKSIKPRCKGGRRSTFEGYSVLFPSGVIDFAVLPAQRFWRETVSLLDIM